MVCNRYAMKQNVFLIEEAWHRRLNTERKPGLFYPCFLKECIVLGLLIADSEA